MNWWAAVDTESVSDSGSSNTVLAVSLGLVALGVILLAVTVWYWRITRPDPDALGPLVVMSDRDFARRGPIERRRALDAARPGAVTTDDPLGSEMEPSYESEGPAVGESSGATVGADGDEDETDDWDDDEFDGRLDFGDEEYEDDEFDDDDTDAPESVPPVQAVSSRPIDPLLSRIDPGSAT